MSKPKFDVKVKLTGNDGNAFFILGRVANALHDCGASKEQIAEFKAEAKSGDYNNLLRVCAKWVDVC